MIAWPRVALPNRDRRKLSIPDGLARWIRARTARAARLVEPWRTRFLARADRVAILSHRVRAAS